LTDKAFAAFKADHSSHLKLLYCIDMFNEGIHVDDVAGVILFRPTVSPIIYKQQIGRALSAGKGREPIIFDIINNFDNLYSIQTIQNEMRDALCLYKERGEKGPDRGESFTLIDEVQDCRRLFSELNEILGASWNQMYRHCPALLRRTRQSGSARALHHPRRLRPGRLDRHPAQGPGRHPVR